MSLTISPIGTQPIIPQPEPTPTLTSSSSTLDTSLSPTESSRDDLYHQINDNQIAVANSTITRSPIYEGIPTYVRNISAYVIPFLTATTENSGSEHPVRDAMIGIAADSLMEVTLARCIGANPAGIAILTGNLIGEPLKEALPSWKELGQRLASKDPYEAQSAEDLGQLRVIAEILTLPATAVHVISKLAKEGFDRLSGSNWLRNPISSSSSSVSSSSSLSSTSSHTALPEADETITLGKLEKYDWEIINLRIVYEIVHNDSSLVPPELESVASSALSSLSISSDLEKSHELLPEKESSRENKQSDPSSIKWTGVQVHVPLERIKKMRISTGFKFGQEGAYQTGLSSTLSQPRKDLRVSASAEIAPGVSGGVSISTRHPKKDIQVSAFTSSGLGLSTSTRQPAKDLQAHVPVLPLTVVSVPLRHPENTRIGIGIPGTPISVSVPVKTVLRTPEKVVSKIAKKVFGRHRRRG